MSATRTIRGAVLNTMGAPTPYASSRPLTVEDLELAGPGPGELLVRIEAAGLCHSDLSVVNGSRPRPLPMLLGHEAAGIVEEVGDGVASVEPGQRVVMTFLPRCGECAACATEGRLPCERGSAANAAGTLLTGTRHLSRPGTGEVVQHHLGVSGFATYAVVDERSVVPVGGDVPPPIAALLGCAVLTGGGALLNAGRITPETSVAVVGLGGVGMAGLLTAVGTGCRVIAVDAQESKLATALEWGAAEAMTPAQALERKAEASVVLEAVGHPRAFETAFRLLGLGGTLVTVGLPAPGALAEIEPLQLTAKAQTVVGSYLGSAVPKRDVPAFEALWREGRLPLERLVSRTIALEDINEGMDALASGEVIRQVVAFDGAPVTTA
ncbi:alcohol dehydrogenase [Sinomonas cellulolyticus]|uniref:Alcohol dehydrogenase catalytic domain-containing protein n=1 Tax=Sinomonas cellulolyticus TaxID=2801916 RepID=A0ABS1JYD5_9MICC|nr:MULTISPECIES: alcohol dehydrogenase catalytic domain-containing protein [Sinomonas]MBL0704213.1 alcohol dehydrogenase catalytic domain-containing protein [Sinomonas cellulolyticus]GHG58302.1 alcohol dehydrogenase [Sinomonas sp. KCTC 49339]